MPPISVSITEIVTKFMIHPNHFLPRWLDFRVGELMYARTSVAFFSSFRRSFVADVTLRFDRRLYVTLPPVFQSLKPWIPVQ